MSQSNMIVTALHGFLGRPMDWTGLFQRHALQTKLRTDDLFAKDIPNMWEWADKFNSRYKESDKNVLLGYSLGGRLALHALISNSKIWSSAVIISAHLGLNSYEEKMGRQEMDEHWARRFENDPWEQVMKDWNQRETFKQDSFKFDRKETEYSRTVLAKALRKWSLSQQDDLRQKVSGLPMPILWIAGAEDAVYAQQALHLRLCHPLSEIWIVPQTGHRVPWQCPEKFLLKITQFLEYDL